LGADALVEDELVVLGLDDDWLDISKFPQEVSGQGVRNERMLTSTTKLPKEEDDLVLP
jgi:hypothetical protein